MAVTRCTWEEAQRLAKRSPSRGFMPPASAIEIVLPDIGGTYADIQRFACVPWELRYAYHRARGEAFAYGGDERRERAEDLLDAVLTAWADATLCHGCKCELAEGEERYWGELPECPQFLACTSEGSGESSYRDNPDFFAGTAEEVGEWAAGSFNEGWALNWIVDLESGKGAHWKVSVAVEEDAGPA